MMDKKIGVVLFLVMLVTAGYSQVERHSADMQTLFGNGNGFGGYLGFNSHYTTFSDQEALMLGGELTAVFGHSFNMGFKGYGLVTPVYVADQDFQRKQLGLGYGGLNLEPVLFSNSAVHLTIPVLLGVGGVTNFEPFSNQYPPDGFEEIDFDEEYHHQNSDVFLVLEPGVMVELNLLKFMRVSGGVSYRLTDGLDLGNADVRMLDGMNYDVSLKFGIF